MIEQHWLTLGDISPHRGQICSVLNGRLTRKHLICPVNLQHSEEAVMSSGCCRNVQASVTATVAFYWRWCAASSAEYLDPVSIRTGEARESSPGLSEEAAFKVETVNLRLTLLAPPMTSGLEEGRLKPETRGWKSDYLFIQPITDKRGNKCFQPDVYHRSAFIFQRISQ